MRRAAPLAVALSVAALAACGGGGEARDEGAAGAAGQGPIPEPFIALERDFQGFSGWKSYELGHQEGNVDLGEPAGTRTTYVSRVPDADATSFPVGTILVKKIVGDVAEDDRVFAMAKRGAGFNAIGAVGWEWFELSVESSGHVGIVWRGVAPPPGNGYGTSLGGSCNLCHVEAAKDDYVLTPALSLAK